MTAIVIMSSAIYGHVAPLRAIATDLVQRGHDVTFVTGPLFEADVRRTGARFVPVHGPADLRLEQIFALRDQVPAGPEQLNWDMQHLFIDPLPVQHEALQEQLAAASGPVLLIADSWCLGAWPVALGAPGRRPAASIGIGVSVLTSTSTDAGPYGLGLPPDATPAGRERNERANAGYRDMVGPTQKRLEHVLAELGARQPAPFFFDGLASVPDRTLQLCPRGFEYPRSDAPPGVRFVGPLRPVAPTQQERDALPAWWADVEAADRVVVVSQGTIANRDASALFEPALRALADVDALVVVTTGHDGAELRDLPANARVGAFVPFELLLPHADVLVTNGGYGGVLQALAHGVPLVVAGDSEDKPEVAARVAWSGCGVDLHTGHPGDDAVRQAVLQVLGDPSFRTAARRLQSEIASHDPLGEVAAQVDELLTAGQAAS